MNVDAIGPTLSDKVKDYPVMSLSKMRSFSSLDQLAPHSYDFPMLMIPCTSLSIGT